MIMLVLLLTILGTAAAGCIPIRGQWITGQDFASVAAGPVPSAVVLSAPDWRARRTVTRAEASKLGIEFRNDVQHVCFERATRIWSRQDVLQALNREGLAYDEVISAESSVLPEGTLEVVQRFSAGEGMDRVALKVVYAPGRSAPLWAVAKRARKASPDGGSVFQARQGEALLILVPLEDAVLTMQSTALSDSRDGLVEVRLLGTRTHRVRLVGEGKAVLGG